MDFTNLTSLKEILKKHDAFPSKTMGQNFLVDKTVLSKIMAAANLNQEDTVLEVGPGLGILTVELAKAAKKVIAVEKDSRMVTILEDSLATCRNVEVKKEDILIFSDIPVEPYKIVANIPYYLTSPLIRKFLETEHQPQSMILMVQKEVAKRICEKPPHMSLLAVSVQFYAKTRIISTVSKHCFWPSPKVDSAIIEIIPYNRYSNLAEANAFFKVVKAGFSQPRKQLVNNFSKSLGKEKSEISVWLSKNNLSPTQRAETLTIEDWIHLINTLEL